MEINNFINERTTYHKRKSGENIDVFDKIQKLIYNVIYIMLKDDNVPDIITFFNAFLEFMEFMRFPFSNDFFSIWGNADLSSTILNIISNFDLQNYTENQTKLAFLLIFYTLMLIVVLTILNIFYVIYSFNRNYFTYTWPLVILNNIVKIFLTLLFMPILEYFISVFLCTQYTNTSGNVINVITPTYEIVCFSTEHVIYCIISALLCSIFTFICIIVAINFFQSSPIQHDLDKK